jgi:hypothetical protein
MGQTVFSPSFPDSSSILCFSLPILFWAFWASYQIFVIFSKSLFTYSTFLETYVIWYCVPPVKFLGFQCVRWDWVPCPVLRYQYYILFVPRARLTIKLDRLIVLSESSLLGWFLRVSLIVIIKGRSPMEVSLIVIIKQVSAWLSLIIKPFSRLLSQLFQFCPWFTGPNRWQDKNLI